MILYVRATCLKGQFKLAKQVAYAQSGGDKRQQTKQHL